MALNGDTVNHSSTSNKSVKKMKKRKELDALLSGANGKAKPFTKPSNKPPKKEGHELLIPDDTDSLDSSENDFFSKPQKTIIRKPHQWRICATCIPLCIFVLTLACIVVTTGLIWMHLDLKQDLDDLRERLAKVESDVTTSQTQAATVSSLEDKLEKLQGLIIKNQKVLTQMTSLNQSINEVKTQVKVLKSSQSNNAASNELQLQQEVANIGAKLNDLTDMEGTVKELQNKMNQATVDIDHLKTIGAITPSPSTLHQLQQLQPREHNYDSLPSDRDSIMVLSVKQELQRVSGSLTSLNDTVNYIKQYQQGLDARLTLLEAMGIGNLSPHHTDETVTIPPKMMMVFTQIHSDVNTLMNWYNETQLNRPTDSTSTTLASTLADKSDDPGSTLHNLPWEQYVNDTLITIQTRIDALPSSQDFNNNNNPPSTNTTANLAQTLQELNNTYTQEMGDVQHDQRTMWDELNTLSSTMTGVQTRFRWVYDRIAQLQTAMNGTDQGLLKGTQGTTTTSGGFTPVIKQTTGDINPSVIVTQGVQKTTLPTPLSTHTSTRTSPNRFQTSPLVNSGIPSSKPTPSSTPGNPITSMHLTTTVKSTTVNSELVTDIEEYTTDDGLVGPEWQRPLNVYDLQPTSPPTVNFPGVKNIEDLRNRFFSWDLDSDGFVTYNDLADHMGPFTPDERAMMHFDKDKDGRFNLHELMTATGLEL